MRPPNVIPSAARDLPAAVKAPRFARGDREIASSGAALRTVPAISKGLDLQLQSQSIQLRRRPVESLAAIDVLDLDDPATVPADSVDRLDPVAPVAYEPAFDDLRHGLPV